MNRGTAWMLPEMAVLVTIITWPSLGFAQLSDEEYVRQALAAGPESVSKNAAVVT